MARGNAREPIFLDDDDRQAFLDGVARACERFDWVLWAYCLMGNHYHLLVETRRASLSRGMREINGNYTQAFNRRRGRVGHLFQGRFKAILIDKNSYLTELSRYIVLNPVRAGLCAAAGDWPWSSYPAVMDRSAASPRLAVDETLSLFGTSPGPARRAYARFVAAGVGADDPALEVSGQTFLGNAAFIARATRDATPPSREVPRRARAWRTLAQYHEESLDRDTAIRAAYASGGYTLAQIGAHFGLHYATISRIARRG